MRMRVLLLAVGFLCVPTLAVARPGDLDPAFSRDGFAPIRLPTERAIPEAVVVDDADRIVVAGFVFRSDERNSKLLVARLLPNGRPDRGFGRAGRAIIEIGGPLRVYGATIDVAGRVLVVGTRANELFVARLLGNGRLDSDFGAGGLFSADSGPNRDSIGRDVVAMADGGVFAVGSSRTSDGEENLLTVRLDASGRLVQGGSGGLQTWRYEADGPASGLSAVQTERGSVYVAGESGSSMGLAMFTPEGSPDPTFGTGGFASYDRAPNAFPSYSVAEVTLDRAGRPLMAVNECSYGRYTTCRSVLARTTPAGVLDPSFDRDGWQTDLPRWILSGVTVQPNGRILVSATAGPSGSGYGSNDFAVLRLRADGRADEGFAREGMARIDFGFAAERAVGVDLQADGGIVVAGETDGPVDYFNEDFLVARYETRRGGADADADGFADRVDDCPARYAAANSGCPLIRTFVALRPDDRGRVVIDVRSKASRCELAKVQLLRRRPGKDRLLVSATTNRYGNYGTRPDPPLNGLYAQTLERRLRGVGICRAARSNILGA